MINNILERIGLYKEVKILVFLSIWLLIFIEPLSKFPVAIKWIFLRTFFLYGFRLLDRVCQKPHKKNLHKNLLFADHGEFRKRFIIYQGTE